jgi:hypothetical protein
MVMILNARFEADVKGGSSRHAISRLLAGHGDWKNFTRSIEPNGRVARPHKRDVN